VLLASALLQLWMSTRAPGSDALLEGSWQSCLQTDGSGDYAEVAWDYYDPSTRTPLFELHLGPRNEFSLFKGVRYSTAIRHVEVALDPVTVDVAELNLRLDIRRAGGSRDECESFFLTVRRLHKERPPKE